MNILMLTPDYPPVYGGIGTHVYGLVHELSRLGHDVTVIVTRMSRQISCLNCVTIATEENITVVDIPFETINADEKDMDIFYINEKNILNQCGSIYTKIREYLPCKKYDVIHMHDAYSGITGKILSNYWGIPLVVTIHSMHANKGSIKYYLREYAVCNSDYVIAVSEFIRNKIIDSYTIHGEKVSVIYNSINVRTTNKEQGELTREVSFCGRFEKIKGVLELVTVYKNVIDEIGGEIGKAKIILNLIGDGSLKDDLFSLIKRLGLEDHVHVYLNISNDAVLNILSKSCCLVIPSYEEPFATVGLEAMSVKTPVICSRTGGMIEMIEHNKTGYIFDINDLDQLKRYMIDLLRDDVKVNDFGKKGFELLNEKFSWKINAHKIVDLYNSLKY